MACSLPLELVGVPDLTCDASGLFELGMLLGNGCLLN